MQWSESFDPLTRKRKIKHKGRRLREDGSSVNHHLWLLGPAGRRVGSCEQIKPRAPSGPLGTELEQYLCVLKESQRSSVQELWVTVLETDWQRAFLTHESKDGI